MAFSVKAAMSKLAAIGAIRRRGVGGLQAYGGKIEGSGKVIHKHDMPEHGIKAGDVTHFEIEGSEAAKN